MIHSSQSHILEFCFPSAFGCEKIVLDAISTFAYRCGFSDEQIANLKTALGEACVNAIEHGNQCCDQLQVQVHCMYDKQCLSVDVRDQGLKKYQVSSPPASIEHKLQGRAALRGMGLSIIGQLVDEAGFIDSIEHGNQFRFTMYRRSS
ncbi:MAG: ATP-binding protein [Chloroflexota bacterium]